MLRHALLANHGDLYEVLRVDEVIVAVQPSLEADPVDAAGEPRVRQPVLRRHRRSGLEADVCRLVLGEQDRLCALAVRNRQDRPLVESL